jgi:hypothetical protein
MKGKRAMLLAGVGALAALMAGVPAQAQSTRVAVWGDRTGFDDYDWIDRADAISETIGESPPDTSFVFEQGEPWAWTLEDGTMMIVEQLPDGPHGYYFEPGTDAPFLVRDPSMSFGFIDGAVAVVYGADGSALSQNEGRSWLGTAMRGYERGKRIKRAMVQRDRQRNVNVNRWYDMSYLLFDWWDDWDYGLSRNPVWRRHHDGPRGAGHGHRWDHERQRRTSAADIFRRWGQGGYRGRPPGHFTPPAAGTPPPPRRWDGRGNGRPGEHGEHRPRDRRDPRFEGGLQPDMGVNPAQGGGQQQQQGGVSRPVPMPRPGSGGFRPRPEPQAQMPETVVPQAASPVAVTPDPAPVGRPLPQPRPDRGDRGDGGGRFHAPRPMPETSGSDTPPQPSYTAPEPRPARTERQAYTPPAASGEAPRSFTPRPERTFTPTPTPAPAPTRSYTPTPTPAPEPTRSYSPTPTPAPAPSHSAPEPSSSRSDSRPLRSNRD